MKKTLLIAILILAPALAGCPQQPYKKPVEQPPMMDEKELLKVRPASQLPPPDPAKSGAVHGTIQLNNFSERKGHLFVYVIDPHALPQEIVVVASAFFASSQLTRDYFEFELDFVPEGNQQIDAVWDTSPPYCVVTDPYCPASTKDGMGQTAVIGVEPGSVLEDVYIEVN